MLAALVFTPALHARAIMRVGVAAVAAASVIGAVASSANARRPALAIRNDAIQQAMQLTADALSVKYNMSIALA